MFPCLAAGKYFSYLILETGEEATASADIKMSINDRVYETRRETNVKQEEHLFSWPSTFQ
jgi:hypothetical protein